MANCSLFPGHWYTTAKVPYPEAVTDRNGRAIAVYHGGWQLTGGVDKDGKPDKVFSEFLAFQNAAGHDLTLPVHGQEVIVRMPPAEFDDLTPLVEADDLPGDRKIDLPPGLKLA